MTIIKKSERNLKARHLIAGLKDSGNTVKEIGKFSKWIEVYNGKLQWSNTLYEIEADGKTAYFLVDSLGWVACVINPDKNDVMDWLKNHGYKTEKDWYIEDYGMSEETWNAWNGETE